MPQIIPVVVALVVEELVTNVVLRAIITIAVSALLSSAVQKRKNPPATQGLLIDQSRTDMVRQPLTPWRTIYGEVMVGGAITFINSTNDNNYLNILLTVASHPVESIGSIYLDGTEVFSVSPTNQNGNGETTGNYAGVVQIWRGNGTTAGDAALLAAMQSYNPGLWTADHKQEGRAKIYVRIKSNRALFPSGIPHIKAVIRGKKVFDPRTGVTAYSQNPALCLRDYLTDQNVGMGAGSDEVDDTAFIAAANVCDESVSTSERTSTVTVERIESTEKPSIDEQRQVFSNDKPNGRLVVGPISYAVTFVNAAGESTPGPRLLVNGHFRIEESYNYVGRIVLNVPYGPEGTTARKIYRSESETGLNGTLKLCATLNDNSTRRATDNTDDNELGAAAPGSNTCGPSGRLVRDTTTFDLPTGAVVRLSTTGTLPAPLAAATDYYVIRTDATRFKLASTYTNAVSNTPITLTAMGSGTHTVARRQQARYTCNGVLDADKAPKDAINGMVSSCAGKAAYINGQFVLYAGAYRTPSVTITTADLVGPVKVTAALGRRDLFNGVRGTYVDPDQNWQPTNFPPYAPSSYLTADGGQETYSELELPFTTSPTMAQRIASISLEAARRQITVALSCKLTVMDVAIGDTVYFTYDRMGWSAKTFEVIDFEFVNRNDKDAPNLGVNLVMRETDANVYAWNSSNEGTLPARPATDLPSPFEVAAPGAPTVTESLYEQRDGTIAARADLAWAASADGFLTHYRVRYKEQGDEDFTDLAITTSLAATLYQATPGRYVFQVIAVNQIGKESDPATTIYDIEGLSASPGTIAGLTISAIGGLAVLRWDRVTDLDVLKGGYIKFRHYYAQSGATWNDSVSIGEAVPGDSNSVVLPLKSGTYLAKAVDAMGQESLTAATVTTNAGTVVAYTNAANANEDPSFTGTKTNVIAVDSLLKLDSGTAIDSWGLIDSVVDWDSGEGVATSGTYEFANKIDLGSAQRVRLTTDLIVSVVNTLDLIDARTANIDDWTDFDGTAGAVADIVVYAAETADNPNGVSPTWSAWQRLDRAEYNNRGYKFYAELSTNDPAYNIHVSRLRVAADVPA